MALFDFLKKKNDSTQPTQAAPAAPVRAPVSIPETQAAKPKEEPQKPAQAVHTILSDRELLEKARAAADAGDIHTAYGLFKELAHKGDPEAQLRYSEYFEMGWVVDEDPEKAFYWSMQAARQGYAEAQYDVGNLYSCGEGTDADPEQALHWYLQAAKQGHAFSVNTVAECYGEGIGTEVDYVQSLYWYLKSAWQDDLDAQVYCGLYYKDGKGTPVDYERSLYWFSKAAAKGSREAQFYCGLYHQEGKGTNVNLERAFYWFQKAAEPDEYEPGHAEAQYWCGWHYYRKGDRNGGSINRYRAIQWLGKSVDQGPEAGNNRYEDAVRLLDQLNNGQPEPPVEEAGQPVQAETQAEKAVPWEMPRPEAETAEAPDVSVKAHIADSKNHKSIKRIVLVGANESGKSTLLSAMTYVLAKTGRAEFVDAGSLTQPVNSVEFDLDSGHYILTDCDRDIVGHILDGSVQIDGAILVVPVTDTYSRAMDQQLMFLQRIGVREVVPFISKNDLLDDDEILQGICEDVYAYLDSYGFREPPVLAGSAGQVLEGGDTAGIGELLQVMDAYFTPGYLPSELPFMMPVDGVFTITGRGTVATGTIEEGMIQVGDEVHILGMGFETKTSVVTGIEHYRNLLDSSCARKEVGLLVRGIKKEELARGMTVTKDKSLRPHYYFNALVGSCSRHGSLHFASYTADVPADVRVSSMCDEYDEVEIYLDAPVALMKGQRFSIHDDTETITCGIIVELLA